MIPCTSCEYFPSSMLSDHLFDHLPLVSRSIISVSCLHQIIKHHGRRVQLAADLFPIRCGRTFVSLRMRSGYITGAHLTLRRRLRPNDRLLCYSRPPHFPRFVSAALMLRFPHSSKRAYVVAASGWDFHSGQYSLEAASMASEKTDEGSIIGPMWMRDLREPTWVSTFAGNQFWKPNLDRPRFLHGIESHVHLHTRI